MDERDFAELISVFLKGTEPKENPESRNESETDSDTDQQASNAEFRRNIIEALAERIKESQGMGQEEELADLIPVEAELLGEAIIFESNGAGTQPEEPEQPAEEQLVTKEEVDKLLSKNEPADIIPLQRILHRFLELDGVIAALLVTRDGFTVDYASNIEFEFDMISAVIATGFNALDKIGYELNQGGLEIAMLEYENGPVVVTPLIHDVALVIVASQWTTLGRIRWEIKKQGDELKANL